MIKEIDIKHLTRSIQEHAGGKNQVTYLNETTINLNGQKIRITGNLLTSDRLSCRFHNIKDILLSLWESGLLYSSAETLKHIQSRYSNLEGALSKEQFINRK